MWRCRHLEFLSGRLLVLGSFEFDRSIGADLENGVDLFSFTFSLGICLVHVCFDSIVERC